MKELPDNSVHAVVTDPPYGLAFMGREWDDFSPQEYQRFCAEWARECKRVLKPGGHLLAFSGNRTHHRLFAGVEDAGFEIRDTITWHYGSGFPKAADISKMIDKRRDEEEVREVTEWLRERIDESDTTDDDLADALGVTKSQVTSHWAAEPRHKQPQVPSLEYWARLKELVGFSDEMDDSVRYLLEKGTPGDADHQREVVDERNGSGAGSWFTPDDGSVKVTDHATDAAKKWNGWKTQLKPSTEFVVVARAPLSENTITENVLEHGTGALNIDECRIPLPTGEENPSKVLIEQGGAVNGKYYEQESETAFQSGRGEEHIPDSDTGRYPTNTVFDEIEAEKLDANNGERESPTGVSHRQESQNDCMSGKNYERVSLNGYGDSGGPSRYYYTSKANNEERTGAGKRVDHPTVKPLDLMEWLIKLVTREGQIVLDPFAGTGTTLEAAKECGREFVGIEKQSKWAKVARIRVGLEKADSDFLEGPQQSLNEFTEE